MIINYSRDGEKFNSDVLQEEGFELHEDDYRQNNLADIHSGEVTDDYYNVFGFVGFLINTNNDIFTVFPKNYTVLDPEKDSNKLFAVMSKHFQKRPDLYFGKEYGKRFRSNYPFASFFGIYAYYKKYGLHFEDKKYIRPNVGGKVKWKETIRFSNKYIVNDQVTIFPLYYEKKYYYSAFLTDCIVFSINHTINKFNIFINLEKIDKDYSLSFSVEEKKIILEKLYLLRQQTFRDNLLELIDHLINFFSELQEGGRYYFKHYSFFSIWEEMVSDYLKQYFQEVKDNKIVFGKKRASIIEFSKVKFYPNIANVKHYFIPDCYYAKNDTQFIFDAKYYAAIDGINYKQISYHIFLSEYRDNLGGPIKYPFTYSALILPGERRESKIHFQMDPKFNLTNRNLIISEEYLDIREIIEFYALM